jgi:hypothetical protein
MRKIVLFMMICGSLSLVASQGWCQVSPPALSTDAGIANQILERIGTPVFNVSWAATGSITARASAAGSLTQSFFRTIFMALSTTEDRVQSGNGDGKLEFDARGLWLGATLPVRLTDSVTWSTRAEYFVPFRNRIWASASGTKSSSTTDTLFVGGVPVATFGPFSSTTPGDVELDASVRTTWFFIDAEIAYSGLLEGTSILAGVRYDRLLSSIGPTVLPRNITIPVPASVTAELNSVCPYLGLRTSLGGPFRGVTFEIKGLPTVIFTNARYTAQNGYFGEFKGEYYGSLANNLSMSLFVKGDIIHASFTELTDFTRLFTVEGDVPFGPGGPSGSSVISQNSSGEVSTSVHWSQLAFGGSFVLSF